MIGAITPWNYPILLAFSKVAPALLVGNTMVLKPSPYTPLSTLRIGELLRDDDLQGEDLMVRGERRLEGVGVLEAPRGTLFHHYQIDENDQVTMCNLIVSTTSNNESMNRAITKVAQDHLSGHSSITEGMLNHVEVAIRAYDPCLSCATHAVGQMPLKVTIYDSQGQIVEEKTRAT